MASVILDLDQPISPRYELILRNIQTNLVPIISLYDTLQDSSNLISMNFEFINKLAKYFSQFNLDSQTAAIFNCLK